jgi:HEAT repeat protein
MPSSQPIVAVAKDSQGSRRDSADQEASVDGKKLSEWLVLQDSSHDTDTRLRAVSALGKFHFTRQEDIQHVANYLADRVAWDTDGAVALAATTILVQLGDPGLRAIDQSFDLDLIENKMQLTTIGPVATAGEKGVAPLVKILRHENQQKAILAVSALSRIGKPAVPALIRATYDSGDRSNQVIALAILSLGQIGPDASEALPAIRGRLNDRNQGVRRMAEQAVGAIERSR